MNARIARGARAMETALGLAAAYRAEDGAGYLLRMNALGVEQDAADAISGLCQVVDASCGALANYAELTSDDLWSLVEDTVRQNIEAARRSS